jgi:hypothetical protein
MNNKSRNQSDPIPKKGGPADAGKDLRPLDKPSDESSDDSTAEPCSREIPIGRPISDDEYQKLKKEAEKIKPPPASSAQEDV